MHTPSRVRARHLLLLGLATLVGCSSSSGNRLVDTDGNGAIDRVVVGDWDGNGKYETRDVQAAIDSLDDSGAKYIELQPGLEFLPVDISSLAPGAHGFVELPSNTTLDCRGSALMGADADSFVQSSSDSLLATVTNADHESSTAEDIHIVDCEISGGMPDSYSSLGFPHYTYMGVAFIELRNSSIVRSRIRNTVHACVYARNVADLLVEDNEMERCGSSGDVRGGPTQPGFYIFQAGSRPTERVVVRGNRVVRTGHASFNTRVSHANAEYQTAWMRDVTFEDNYGEDDDGDACFRLRGVRKLLVKGNTCVATSGLSLGGAAEGYCSDNPPVATPGAPERDCLEDVRIEENLFLDSEAAGSNPILDIYDYHDGVRLARNTVTRVSGVRAAPSLRVQLPLRGLYIEDLVLEDCAGPCVEFVGAAQQGVPEEERIVVSGLVADGAGQYEPVRVSTPCFRFFSRLEEPLLEDLTALRCSGTPLWIAGATGGTLRSFHIDGVPIGYGGSFSAASGPLPACDAGRHDSWIVLRDSDGSCSDSAGAETVRCTCRAGIWRPYALADHPGVLIDDAEGIVLEDGVVENVERHTGILFSPNGAHLAGLQDVLLRQPALGSAVIAPMDNGVRDASSAGQIDTIGVVCEPNAVAGSCVDVP